MHNRSSRRHRHATAAAVVALAAACSGPPGPVAEQSPTPAVTPSPTPTPDTDLYYASVQPNFCHQLELTEFLTGLGFGPDISTSDGVYNLWPSPGSPGEVTPAAPEQWTAYCLAKVADDTGREDVDTNLDVSVYTDHEAAEIAYQGHLHDHPRDIAHGQIEGWWDSGIYREITTLGGRGVSVSHHVRHENLVLSVWVGVGERDRDRDEALSIGHDTAAALVDHMISHVPLAAGE